LRQVSLTTEHWTDELRAGYVVDYANGLLRPLLGAREPSRKIHGPAFYAKSRCRRAQARGQGAARRICR